MKQYYYNKTINLLIRFSFVIIGMASMAMTILKVSTDFQNPALIFANAISFTSGLLISDLNSYGLFQRNAFNKKYSEKGFWLSRALATLIICSPLALLIPDLELKYFLFGISIGFILPSGRASDSHEMPVVQNGNGLVKLLGFVYINSTISKSLSSEEISFLLITMNSGAYLTSVIYIFPKIKKDLSQIKVIQFNLKAILIETLEVLKTKIILLPIHLYTTLGGFLYSYFNGIASLENYYIAEKVIRSLGTTVLAVMSKTTNIITSTAMRYNTKSQSILVKWTILYSIIATFIGLGFYVIGLPVLQKLDYNISFIKRDFTSAIIIIMSTVALYLSTLFGTQFLVVKLKFRAIALSSIIATIVLVICSSLALNPLVTIGYVEVTVAFILLLAVISNIRKENAVLYKN